MQRPRLALHSIDHQAGVICTLSDAGGAAKRLGLDAGVLAVADAGLVHVEHEADIRRRDDLPAATLEELTKLAHLTGVIRGDEQSRHRLVLTDPGKRPCVGHYPVYRL